MAAKIFEITYVACIALWMGTAVLYYYVLKSSSLPCACCLSRARLGEGGADTEIGLQGGSL